MDDDSDDISVVDESVVDESVDNGSLLEETVVEEADDSLLRDNSDDAPLEDD